ncbi:MAG: C4-dicarboxylate transporter DctA [Alphaproteobacteria bacterium]
MTGASSPRFNPVKSLLGSLWFQVLLGMVAGVALGWLRPTLGADMKPFGDAFIALVKMLIGPIIFCTVVHGIAGMNDMRKVGRVAFKTLIYFEVMTTLALAVGLIAVNLWRPGAGMNIDPAALDPAAVKNLAAQAKAGTVTDFFLHIIPTTLFSALTQGDTLLQVLLVALLVAFGIMLAGERGRPVFDVIESGTQVLFRIVEIVMWVAPIGAFGAIAFTVGKFGASSLIQLGELILEFYLVCVFFVVVVMGAVAAWARVNIFRLLGYLREELLIILATSSSESALPRVIRKLKDLGCEESVVGLVIPTGYSFNLDGTCLYLSTVAIFLAQATNTHLSLWQQLGLLSVLLITSKGAAGVAGSGLIILAGTLATFGTVPVASVALVVGIHRLLGQMFAMVNMTGNSLATIIVSKWEKGVDHSLLDERIGFRSGGRLKTATQPSE